MQRFLVLLLFCSLYATSYAQETLFQAVDKVFEAWNKPEVPGGALGIIKDGKLIYTKGYGLADLEHDLAIAPSSVFYIGSVSKQFVTFSILLLEEQGKINLDDRIQKYLPDFPEYKAPLTIRHFIHHTSGVRDYLTLLYLKGKNYLDETDAKEVYELIKRQKELNFSPGMKYLYSNSCYFMLAMIIEKAAGQSLKQYASKNIFQPLGMKNTLFYDDNTDLIKNRVFSYSKKDNGEGFNNQIMRFDLVGSGGVYSTIEDLYLWDQNFYNNKLGNGGQAIITRMHEEGLLNDGTSSGYAFALNNGTYKGLKTVSHGGALAGYRAELMRFPDERFSVIVLANRDDANSTSKSYQVADIFLKSKFIIEESITKNEKEKPRPQSARAKTFAMKQVTGRYEIQPGMAVDISIKSDSLHVLQSWNKAEYKIYKTARNTYAIPNESEVQFIFSDLADDFTQTLLVVQNGRETICKRKSKNEFTSIDLSTYAGTYYSEELDVTYSILIEDNKLKLKMASNNEHNLELYDADIFIVNGNLVRFSSANGKIQGFELDAGRVTNLKFQKKL